MTNGAAADHFLLPIGSDSATARLIELTSGECHGRTCFLSYESITPYVLCNSDCLVHVDGIKPARASELCTTNGGTF